MTYLLYNPLSNNSNLKEKLDSIINELKQKYPDLIEYDVTEYDYLEFARNSKDTDTTILVGGDGTINYFANNYKKTKVKGNILFYPGGTGNDFSNDLEIHTELIDLKKYMENLPKVKVKGKEYYFINNVGFGLDGMVCQIADELKAKGKKKISYASISIKLLLYKYKTCKAKVTVDGETKEYKKVWLAPAMNGRCYGGGMLMAPNQDRNSDKMTCIVLHGSLRLRILFIFTTIFKGTHIKYKKLVEVLEGKKIHVEFEKPTAVQIDGETIKDVKEYTATK